MFCVISEATFVVHTPTCTCMLSLCIIMRVYIYVLPCTSFQIGMWNSSVVNPSQRLELSTKVPPTLHTVKYPLGKEVVRVVTILVSEGYLLVIYI